MYQVGGNIWHKFGQCIWRGENTFIAIMLYTDNRKKWGKIDGGIDAVL